jgi:hypothetical protein
LEEEDKKVEQVVGMIDPRTEELVTLKELGQRLQRTYNNIYELVRVGRESVGGKTVQLEVIKTPGGMRTSMEAYYRFLRKLNEC